MGGKKRVPALRRGNRVTTAEMAVDILEAAPGGIDHGSARGTIADAVESFLDVSARTAEGLASVGALAACIAHEINNPLTYTLIKLRSIYDFARAHELPSEQIEDLHSAIEGAGRIARIVRDLDGYVPSELIPTGAVDINRLIASSVDKAGNEARYRAHLRCSLGNVPPVLGDELRLGRVFLNLIVNAAQSIEPGNLENNEIRISTCLTAANTVRIEVADTGHGIPPDLIDRVFEPFVTTRDVGQGTGLGLHVCRQIIASLGGEICVESQLGCGSRFAVTLPVVATDAPAFVVAGEVGAPEAQGPEPRKILVVDDEPLICSVLKRQLFAHAVTIATSGRKAIEALNQEDFDVVLCDLMMADLTGMDVYDHLYAENTGRHRKIVFMTGGTCTPRSQDFVRSVSNRVLKKPFCLETLEQALADALA